MTLNDKRVVCGFKLPSDAPIAENERLWIEMLRLLFHDRVPVPTLPLVQAPRGTNEEVA